MRFFRKKTSSTAPKTWEHSQRYELEHAIGFMNDAWFKKLFHDTKAGKLNLSEGHRDALMLKEFFENSGELFDEFVGHISAKSCLDIGPCVLSPLSTWDVAKQRYVIEPL